MKSLKNIALTLVALVLTVTAINANPVTPETPAKAEPLSVKYIGNDGEYLLFQVIVNADNAKNSSFAISDKSEGEIYSSHMPKGYKVQTMKIEKRDNQELDFKLKIGNEVYSKSFAILSTVTMEAK